MGKGRFRRFVTKTLRLLSPLFIFGCQEPKIDNLPHLNSLRELCATTEYCVPGITELPNGSFNSRIDPNMIDQNSAGNWISSNTMLVKFEEGTNLDEIIDRISMVGGRIASYVSSIDMYCIRLPTNSAQEVEDKIGVLSGTPNVEVAEVNTVLFSHTLDYELLAMDGDLSVWGHERVKLAEAYNYLDENQVVLNPVKVAVFDTSFQLNHKDLDGKFLSGYDVADNDSDPSINDISDTMNPRYFHGTEVSGIIAAKNNNGVDGVDEPLANGVAFNADLIPMKIYHSDPGIYGFINGLVSGGSESILITALELSITEGADVINISSGLMHPLIPELGLVDHLMLKAMIHDVYSHGIVIVGSVGNDNRDATYVYPSSYPEVIAVGSVDGEDKRAKNQSSGSNFSQNGDEDILTLAAPGKGVFCIAPKDIYWDCTGTSYAAPFVSGLAALIKSIYPALTPEEIKQIMVRNADKVCVDYPEESCEDVKDDPERLEAHTWGIINALEVVQDMVAEKEDKEKKKEKPEKPKKEGREIKWSLEFDWESMSTGAQMLMDNDVLYIATPTFGRRLYAISTEGDIAWEMEIPASHSGASIGPDGNIYVWTGNSLGTLTRSAQIWSVTPEGSVDWTIAADDFQVRAFGMPSIASDGRIYVDSAFYLNAINAEGDFEWRVPITLGGYSSRPAISRDGTIYNLSLASPSRIHAINPDGTIEWEQGDMSLYGPLVAIGPNGTIYVSAYIDAFEETGELLALDPVDGSTLWSFGLGRWSRASPIVGPDGTVYMNSCDNILHAIDSNGDLKWQFEERANDVCADSDSLDFLRPLWLTPAITQDGTVYLDDPNAGFAGISSADGILDWEFEPPEGGATHGAPLVGSDGTLYTIEYFEAEGVGSLRGDYFLYAIEGDSTLADSSWPKYQHDNKNSGSSE